MIPSDISTFVEKLPLKKAALTLGVFLAVFSISASATTFLLNEKIAEFHLKKSEGIAVASRAFIAPSLQAQSAVVYDLNSKQVLFEKNANAQLPLASLTKLLTVLTASKYLSANETVAFTRSALNEEGESGFTLGEEFKFDDIARLALVASSNDAAEAIAQVVANREQIASTHTSGLMAGTISALGLSQTYATNATGLDESTSVSGAYGSATDVAHVAESMLKTLPTIAQATTESQASAVSLSGSLHTLANTNPTVTSIPGVLLSKTGYTDLAGGNLVMIFDIGMNHPVAIVVLGSTREGRFTDVSHLRDALVATYLPS